MTVEYNNNQPAGYDGRADLTEGQKAAYRAGLRRQAELAKSPGNRVPEPSEGDINFLFRHKIVVNGPDNTLMEYVLDGKDSDMRTATLN